MLLSHSQILKNSETQDFLIPYRSHGSSMFNFYSSVNFLNVSFAVISHGFPSGTEAKLW